MYVIFSIEKNILMKDLILILNYSPDNKRQELLRKLVNNVKDDDFDIMITTHSFIPQDISDNVDFIIYEKENLLLTDLKSKYNLFFLDDNFKITTTEGKKYNHGYTVLRLLLVGLKSAKSLNYHKVHLIEYDSEIKNVEEFKNNSKLLDKHSIIWYQWETFEFPTTPVSYNLSKISNSFFETRKEKLLEFFDGGMTNMCEQYHMKLINECDNVLKKQVKNLEDVGIKLNLNSDVVRYEWVVPVFCEKTKNMILFCWGRDEISDMEIKLIINNTKILLYVVKPGTWIIRDIDNIDNISNILIIVNNQIRNNLNFNKIDKNYYINRNKIIENGSRCT
jgi:hypothetical protein